MKKIILVMILVFLIGCEPKDNAKIEQVLNIGFEGLSLQFVNSPPPNVFEESSFPVTMKLRNQGTYDIKEQPASISISFEKLYVPSFTLDPSSTAQKQGENEILFTLNGRSRINPKGDDLVLALNARTGKLEQQSESKQSTITATLCYPYKTLFSTTLCLDPDVTGINLGKKACTMSNLDFTAGQGSPVAVTKIETTMVLNDDDTVSPEFLIYFENRGSGTPININNYRSICQSARGTTDDLWNVAFVKASVANSELKCQQKLGSNDAASGEIKFRDKKDYIRCRLESSVKKGSDAYTTAIKVEVSYGYTETYVAPFTINRPR